MRTVTLLAVMASLAACGQKGPLTLAKPGASAPARVAPSTLAPADLPASAPVAR